jgi:hypothetical protein
LVAHLVLTIVVEVLVSSLSTISVWNSVQSAKKLGNLDGI